MAVTMKNGVFRVVTPCGSCKNRRFGGTWRLLHQGDKNRCSSETLLLTRATWRHIPEDGIVQCYRQYAVNGVHFCGDENITAVISMYPLQVKHGQACGNKTCPPPNTTWYLFAAYVGC
jgi:hypothetical protein